MRRIVTSWMIAVLVCLFGLNEVRADRLVLVAGGGTETDNTPALKAKLQGPFGVDFSKDGDFYLVEMIVRTSKVTLEDFLWSDIYTVPLATYSPGVFATTDAKGRVYVGSIAYTIFKGEEPKPGKLYIIDLDGTARPISDGILLTNGLGYSPDGRLLYHSDARRELVRVYDVRDDGSVGHWRAFAAMGPGSVPDGLKVAADGSVWVADAHGGRVAVFGADGRHRRDIPVPRPMVTSLCFGGDDLRDLYIVTGSRGGPSESCGTVYRLRSDVAGLPLPPARVRAGV
jgi:hypothetical protein